MRYTSYTIRINPSGTCFVQSASNIPLLGETDFSPKVRGPHDPLANRGLIRVGSAGNDDEAIVKLIEAMISAKKDLVREVTESIEILNEMLADPEKRKPQELLIGKAIPKKETTQADTSIEWVVDNLSPSIPTLRNIRYNTTFNGKHLEIYSPLEGEIGSHSGYIERNLAIVHPDLEDVKKYLVDKVREDHDARYRKHSG